MDIKPNKIWVDKGSKFIENHWNHGYKKNDTEMYSTHEGRFVVTKIYFRT